jgi:hypothetical protein
VQQAGNTGGVCECVIEVSWKSWKLVGEDRKSAGLSRFWADEGRVSSALKRRGRGSDLFRVGAGTLGDGRR